MTSVPVSLQKQRGRRAIAASRSLPLDSAGTTPEPMPTLGPLFDSFGRVHHDLRISVTDRCNLRCTYCMPERGMTFLPRSALLTFDEIVRVAAVVHRLGVTSIRLTGGEPLVRTDLVDLVARLSSLGLDDLSLTTNGLLLEPLAGPLAEAGLHRVNISCDSLRAARFGSIRRRGVLSTVLRSMDAAEAAGLTPIKVNVVLLRGRNDDEILDFARFARDTGRIVRFIEFMPLDGEGSWERDQVVSGDEVYRRISAEWPLRAIEERPSSVPAERFHFRDGHGEIGLISSVTRPFCGTCNRLRLTADGAVRNCLFSDDELSVGELLRNGGTDEELAMVLRRAVWGKWPGHGINEPGFLRPVRSMSMIGG